MVFINMKIDIKDIIKTIEEKNTDYVIISKDTLNAITPTLLSFNYRENIIIDDVDEHSIIKIYNSNVAIDNQLLCGEVMFCNRIAWDKEICGE